MDGHRRWTVRLARTGTVGALVILGLIVVGRVRPGAWCVGRYAVGVDRFGLNLAEGSEKLVREGAAWRFGGGGPRFILGIEGNWLPERSYARATVSTQTVTTVTHSLNVLIVPLWPWLIGAAMGAGGLWCWSRRTRPLPGHCPKCAYDLRGLGAARCPECGAPAQRSDASPAIVAG